MSRQRTKGTAFETQLVDWLNERFHGERTFHRLGMGGVHDTGDVWGLFAHGKQVVVECKNHVTMTLEDFMAIVTGEREE